MFTSQHDLLLSTVLLVYAGAIAIALGYILSTAFLERIRTLDRAAKAIAEGNLDVRVPSQGKDELATLAQTFNQMAAHLKEATKRKEQIEDLRRDLIAWVSHDLQTPLTSISAIIEALADGIVEDTDTQIRYLNTARKDIASLSDLIDDLFQMAQIDAGGLKLNVEKVSLADLISDTIESFSELASRQGITLTGDADPEIGMVSLDAQRIGRVLNNLINNALRHTPSGGTVRAEAHRVAQEIIVQVTDTGVGILPEDLPNVFDRFYRGEKSRSRSTGGSGLGLAISKGIVEAHNGRITVESRPGSTRFTLTLPLIN
jgi:signal transduction histidine kinase